MSGGVRPKGNRIEIDFFYGRRYQITIDQEPTQANLKRARKRREEILRKINLGTFEFQEEFPEYRGVTTSDKPTFRDVVNKYLGTIGDLAHSSKRTYRYILNGFWIPLVGDQRISEIRYSELATILSEALITAQTKNMRLMVLRRIFKFAKADGLIKEDPTELLQRRKVQKTPPDPYTVDEVEVLLAKLGERYPEHVNYFEFCFFTGARPSEVIAFGWPDVDLRQGVVRVAKARVFGMDKPTTKTGVSRDIELCPRALSVLRRQREHTALAGERVFPYHDIQLPWRVWGAVHKLTGIRYREPYQCRHTHISWCLMLGGAIGNPMRVAEQHGHSAQMMFQTYAKWLGGSNEADLAKIRKAMGYGDSEQAVA